MTLTAMYFRESTDTERGVGLTDDGWVAEPKKDGVRCLVHVVDGTAHLYNREGTPLGAGSSDDRQIVKDAFEELGLVGEWLFDGELIGPVIWLFDMPMGGRGAVGPEHDYAWRREGLSLMDKVVAFTGPAIQIIPIAYGAQKFALHDQAEAEGWEGIMLKRLDAPYAFGPSSAGIKVKFTKTFDWQVMALGIDGKQSAQLGGRRGRKVIEVGFASTIGKEPMKVGDIVEVTCQRITEYGRMISPRIVRVRTDKHRPDQAPTQLEETP